MFSREKCVPVKMRCGPLLWCPPLSIALPEFLAAVVSHQSLREPFNPAQHDPEAWRGPHVLE